jgi:hypothetical protein
MNHARRVWYRAQRHSSARAQRPRYEHHDDRARRAADHRQSASGIPDRHDGRLVRDSVFVHPGLNTQQPAAGSSGRSRAGEIVLGIGLFVCRDGGHFIDGNTRRLSRRLSTGLTKRSKCSGGTCERHAVKKTAS